MLQTEIFIQRKRDISDIYQLKNTVIDVIHIIIIIIISVLFIITWSYNYPRFSLWSMYFLSIASISWYEIYTGAMYIVCFASFLIPTITVSWNLEEFRHFAIIVPIIQLMERQYLPTI